MTASAYRCPKCDAQSKKCYRCTECGADLAGTATTEGEMDA